MHKRILAIVTLLCAVPLIASAWTLNTWVRSQGGTLSVTKATGGSQPASALTYTSLQGSVFKGYTTTTSPTVTITPNSGYFVNALIINGVPTTPIAGTNTVTVPAGADYSIWVDFLRTQLSFNVVAGANGIVTPRGLQPNVYAGVTYRTFSLIPAKGQSVTAVTADVPANIVFSTTTLGQVNKKVIVTVSKILGNVTLTGTFSGASNIEASSSFSNFSGAQTGTPYKAAAACDACHIAQGLDKGRAILTNWSASGHKANAAHGPFCAGCHAGAGTGAHPGQVLQCTACHSTSAGAATATVSPNPTDASWTANSCGVCHNDPAVPNGNFHGTVPSTKSSMAAQSCVACHSIPIVQHIVYDPATYGNKILIGDNTVLGGNAGVRAIIPEFSKRSHHITGATPTDAQCVVCHLEGKVSGTGVVVDPTKHMYDAKIHLRNADDNSDMAWSGTEHTTMDNFCFSCHDSNGAQVAAGGSNNYFNGVTFPNAQSPTNPFGDTLTNGYDQVARAGVVDVKTAFTSTNASHHAVSGQRYTYRFSTLANAQAWAASTGNPVPDASQIAEGHTSTVTTSGSTAVASPFGTGQTFDAAGPEEGGEATLYEAGKFVATYIPLGATQNVADNSTLHCGDCHTVGQWKVGSSTNADGSATSVAIGAHGSVNEYLLRNSLGTDAIHNNLTYVCFNCHKADQEASSVALWQDLVAEGKILPSTSVTNGTYQNTADGGAGVSVPVNYTGTPIPTWKAGWGSLHPTAFMGQITGYAVAHAVSAMHGQCQADSAASIGATRLVASWEPDKVAAYDYLPASGATATSPSAGSTEPYTSGSNANSGNITGISCINCHNSGLRNGWGGIHGGNNTYTDGLGRTQMTYRFMPGMGNYRYAPPGGWDGKDVSDPTLLTANNPQTYGGPANGASTGYPGASGKPMGGCYTNGAADLNPGFSTCSHHGTSTAAAQGTYAPTVTTRSGATANFRTTYGGGTTGSPTTYEPTVREATAGGALVTRPLSY